MNTNSWKEFLYELAADYYKKYDLPVIDKEHNYDKIMDDLEHGITPDMQRYELPVS